MYKELYAELMELLTEGLSDDEFSVEFAKKISEIQDKEMDLLLKEVNGEE